ncbi:MAG: HAMP domain-containing histidine kinase [Lachnospiraceae bacterium]|nr:HAMP domain-containing histidine kinase [Lachnospiraceae bacterium]
MSQVQTDNSRPLNRRTTSIAKKINRSYWFDSLLRMIFLDIIAIAAIVACYFYTWETKLSGTIVDRHFENGYETAEYVVTMEDRSENSLDLFETFGWMEPVWLVIIALELVMLIFGIFRSGRVRRKLKPLNDLAVRAEALSGFSLDDSRLQKLEGAIERAGRNSDDIKVTTGDKELESIEIALNNLLKKMQDTQKQQSRFVSDASHELRTPISVIQGYVNMLDRWGKEDPEVLSEAIEALKNESEHMKELIEQLLFLARGDSGRNTLVFEDFDLRETMQEVWEESLMIDEKHKYVYKNALPEDDNETGERTDDIIGGETAEKYIIHGDKAMVKQSVRILVQNASKYSNEGDTISLDVKKTEGGICYVVQDEGVGMTDTDVVHIFERFYRSDKARNSGTGGSGLGLSIAKWIVDAHNASVEVLSRPDFGTRFTVKFPQSSD